MLQAIRERVTGIVAIFILGLLAVPFLFFGVESYIRAVPQDAVATVGDLEISTAEFQTSFARFRAELRQQQGENYDEIATNQPLVRRQHLDGMIDELLLRQHAESLGLVISPEMLIDLIRRIPAFQIDGQFEPTMYQQALRASGLTPRAFERDLRDDLMTRIVVSSLASSTIVTEAEIDRMLSLQNETRGISLIEVPASLFAADLVVPDDEVEAYYQANLFSFLTPEELSVSYVELDTVAMTAAAELSEDELRQRYEAASQRFLTPELRQASHILIEISASRNDEEARVLAQSLAERIQDGEALADLAREFSDDPGSADQGGDLGWIEAGDMVEAFENALFGLGMIGEVSSPVRTPFGWHVIQLQAVREPQGMSFEEAREEILADFRESEAEELYLELSERLVDLVFADDSSLEPLAAELGLEIRQSVSFGRTGGSGIAAYRPVVEAAFSDRVLLDRTVSDPLELGRNRVVVIQLDQYQAAEPLALESVAPLIRARLLDQKAREAARDYAESLLAQAPAAEASLADLAQSKEGLLWSEHPSVRRFDLIQGPDFLTALFRLPAASGAATLHVLPRAEGYALVRLESVQPGNPVLASDQERQLARQQILIGRINEEVEGLLADLRANTRIRVVEDRI